MWSIKVYLRLLEAITVVVVIGVVVVVVDVSNVPVVALLIVADHIISSCGRKKLIRSY